MVLILAGGKFGGVVGVVVRNVGHLYQIGAALFQHPRARAGPTRSHDGLGSSRQALIAAYAPRPLSIGTDFIPPERSRGSLERWGR